MRRACGSGLAVFIVRGYLCFAVAILLLSRPAVAGRCPKDKNCKMVEVVPRLLAVDSDSGKMAWKEFMFTIVQMRRFAKVSNKQNAKAILETGERWNASGWSSTSAAKRLYDLVGLPLVKAEFHNDEDAWLMCAAFVSKVGYPKP